MSPIVRVVDARKAFGQREVLKGVDLEVERGEVVCIIGASGSGKSTLLRCINQLETLDDGYVWAAGSYMGYTELSGAMRPALAAEVAQQRAKVGMVFQSFNLFPHMTVLENVTMAPRMLRGAGDHTATAQRLLTKVGLGDRGDAWPSQLSGGQQQRVAIARALAVHPG